MGSSATLGASSLLRGSILAHTSITFGAGVTMHGRALALNAAVTLDNDTVSVSHCAGDPTVTLAPVFGDFPATTLNGSAQTKHTTISDWSVNDQRASATSWESTMSASPLATAGPSPITMTGATLTVAAPAATRTDLANTSPAPQGFGGNLRAGSVKVADAAPGTGLRTWWLAQGATDLALGIPAHARAGSYTSTITTTISPGID